ncbi:hypothetical protein AB751O23_BZ_00020 [Chlamydiales bacterium SCGC AB-751-O23]|nr:hypothetical protein AB751O23_BZ_00020 [Chlamydiales bacterium SCGC AB-751-O23]
MRSICFWGSRAKISFYEDFKFAGKTFLFALSALIVVNYLIGVLFQYFSIEIIPQHAVVVIKEQLSLGWKTRFFTIILVCLLGPAYEEFIFRGILQSSWVKSFGKFWGIFIASSIFSLAHLNTLALGEVRVLANLFVFSLFLGVAYEKRKSLLCSVVLHIMLNTTTLFSLMLYQEEFLA